MSSAELRENRTLGRSASGDGRKGGTSDCADEVTLSRKGANSRTTRACNAADRRGAVPIDPPDEPSKSAADTATAKSQRASLRQRNSGSGLNVTV